MRGKVIEDMIPHRIREAVEVDEELEVRSEADKVELMKYPRKCRRCSVEQGVLVPLKGHKCPFRKVHGDGQMR